MKHLISTLLIAILVLANGCTKWGDYQHKSQNFDFKVSFPPGWTVTDQSTTDNDFLVAVNPSIPNAKIEITARKGPADFEPSSYWPQFQRPQKEDDNRQEFKIIGRGSVSCVNTEGRYFEVQYLGEVATMHEYRAAFVGAQIGKRVIVNISAEFPKDDYIPNEPNVKKMISLIEVLK
jgi:hypothetical protein